MGVCIMTKCLKRRSIGVIATFLLLILGMAPLFGTEIDLLINQAINQAQIAKRGRLSETEKAVVIEQVTRNIPVTLTTPKTTQPHLKQNQIIEENTAQEESQEPKLVDKNKKSDQDLKEKSFLQRMYEGAQQAAEIFETQINPIKPLTDELKTRAKNQGRALLSADEIIPDEQPDETDEVGCTQYQFLTQLAQNHTLIQEILTNVSSEMFERLKNDPEITLEVQEVLPAKYILFYPAPNEQQELAWPAPGYRGVLLKKELYEKLWPTENTQLESFVFTQDEVETLCATAAYVLEQLYIHNPTSYESVINTHQQTRDIYNTSFSIPGTGISMRYITPARLVLPTIYELAKRRLSPRITYESHSQALYDVGSHAPVIKYNRIIGGFDINKESFDMFTPDEQKFLIEREGNKSSIKHPFITGASNLAIDLGVDTLYAAYNNALQSGMNFVQHRVSTPGSTIYNGFENAKWTTNAFISSGIPSFTLSTSLKAILGAVLGNSIDINSALTSECGNAALTALDKLPQITKSISQNTWSLPKITNSVDKTVDTLMSNPMKLVSPTYYVNKYMKGKMSKNIKQVVTDAHTAKRTSLEKIATTQVAKNITQ